MKRGRNLLLVLSSFVFPLVLSLGCDHVTRDVPTTAPRRNVLQQPLTTYVNTVTLPPAYDTFIERGVDDHCEIKECDISFYTKQDQCRFLRLEQWGWESECARAHVLLDFRTEQLASLTLPPNAQVTGADNVTLKLYLNKAYHGVRETQPPPPGCFKNSLYDEAPPLASGGIVGWAQLDPGSVGVVANAPIMEDGSCPIGGTGGGVHPYAMPGSAGQWLTEDVSAGFNPAKATRCVLDYDGGPTMEDYRIIEFVSKEHPSQATLGPRLSIDVDYNVTHAICLDGQIDRLTSSCSDCSAGAFATNTTGSIATVLHNQQDPCGDAQVVFKFDTSALLDSHTPSTAELKIFVKNNLSLDVQDARVRVFASQQSGPCPTGLAPTDYAGCGSLVDLGTFPIALGANTFVFSSGSMINSAGITTLVLVDASTYTSENGQVQFEIDTVETSGTTKDPTLKVIYD